MKYAILNTNEHNGTQKGVNIFYAAPILSGPNKGKYATSENALKEFPDIFKELEYEIADLEAKDFEIDLTPPTLYGLGVVIPEQFIWVFPDNKFILEGFEIPLTTKENYLIIDKAYIEWDSFREELKNTEKESAYKIINIIFNYLDEQVKNNNIIEC
jgi:hypothetical protein